MVNMGIVNEIGYKIGQIDRKHTAMSIDFPLVDSDKCPENVEQKLAFEANNCI